MILLDSFSQLLLFLCSHYNDRRWLLQTKSSALCDAEQILYVMALQPNLLSGLDRAIALAWSKAQCRVRNVSRVCFDYETHYSGDLCAEFKNRLNDFEILFEYFMTEVML